MRSSRFLFILCLLVMVTNFGVNGIAQDEAPAKPAVNNAPVKPSKATPTTPSSANAASTTNAVPAAPDVTTQSSQAVPPAATADSDPSDTVASSEPRHPLSLQWPFAGTRGYVDRQAAQRGFQIYSQVCSACHSMNLVAYRSLTELGFSEAEIKALAAQKQVADIDDKGNPIQRPATPSDHFVPTYANEAASRAANNGAYPPDLSLIIKARHNGPNYVYSLLTGFSNPPSNEAPVAGKYYNPYFAGHWISMPPPLHDNAVTYQDGTPSSVDQMARDVVVFLQWAAEPEMEQRHAMGIRALLFLFVMACFFYVAKKRVWKDLDKK